MFLLTVPSFATSVPNSTSFTSYRYFNRLLVSSGASVYINGNYAIIDISSFSSATISTSSSSDLFLYGDTTYIGTFKNGSPLVVDFDSLSYSSYYCTDLFISDFITIYYGISDLSLFFKKDSSYNPISIPINYYRSFYLPYIPSSIFASCTSNSNYYLSSNDDQILLNKGSYSLLSCGTYSFLRYFSPVTIDSSSFISCSLINDYLFPLSLTYSSDEFSGAKVNVFLATNSGSGGLNYEVILESNNTYQFIPIIDRLVGYVKITVVEEYKDLKSYFRPYLNFLSHLTDPFVYISNNISYFQIPLVFLFSIVSILIIIFLIIFIVFRIRKGKG